MSQIAVVIGAGGFGREARDWLIDSQASHGLEFAGFLDDGVPNHDVLRRIGARHLGPVDRLAELVDAVYYIGVGDPATRRRLAEKAQALGARPGPPIIHPRAHMGSDVAIGDGSIVCPGVMITTNVRIGDHVHLNLNVTVGHDTTIEDFVTVNPGATVSGDVRLEDGVMVGTNSAILQGLTLGSGAVLGGGAVAVKNLDAGVTAVGVPARPR